MERASRSAGRFESIWIGDYEHRPFDGQNHHQRRHVCGGGFGCVAQSKAQEGAIQTSDPRGRGRSGTGDRDLIAIDGVREWLGTARRERAASHVAGADHASFLDEPDKVIGAIDAFLAEWWPEQSQR